MLKTVNFDPINYQALIFLPGMLCFQSDYQEIFKRYLKNYNLYFVDFSLIAKSHQQIDWESFLVLLEQELKKIENQKLILIGYSLGSRIAIGLANRSQLKISGLFLESFNYGISESDLKTERFNFDCQLADKANLQGTEEFVKIWYQSPVYALNPSEYSSLIQSKKDYPKEMIVWLLKNLSVGRMPCYQNFLKDITFKLLLIVGEKDQKFLEIAQNCQNLNTKISLKIASNVGHNIHFQNLEFYNSCLDQFLSELIYQ